MIFDKTVNNIRCCRAQRCETQSRLRHCAPEHKDPQPATHSASKNTHKFLYLFELHLHFSDILVCISYLRVFVCKRENNKATHPPSDVRLFHKQPDLRSDALPSFGTLSRDLIHAQRWRHTPIGRLSAAFQDYIND